MTKVYDYKAANEVISEAWNLAIEHLEKKLGDQYNCNVTENAMDKFWDCVQQDIEYKKECPRCSNVDIEGNFSYVKLDGKSIEVCYNCYEELTDGVE